MLKVVRLRRDALDAQCRAAGVPSTYALAQKIGMTYPPVYRVMHGQAVPGERFIAAVTGFFGASIDDLFEVVDVDEEGAA